MNAHYDEKPQKCLKIHITKQKSVILISSYSLKADVVKTFCILLQRTREKLYIKL